MKTHAIITYSKIHYLLDENQHKELQSKKLDDILNVDGNSVKVRNIADILTMSKYYEAYPDKRPQRTDIYKNFEPLGMAGVIRFAKGDALKGMIKGLKRYINSDQYQGGKEPLELLKQMEAKLLI